ncbi:8-amino-7-oxononanoate synthase [Neisseriaceae bacterium TC5R-5]|nr:8-amino-7-oxononanoate synthase [Neisseriaceae bacterium TC5R-5]
MLPQDLPAALLKLDTSQLRRQRAVLDTPQGVEIAIAGQNYLSFASNDYLGLANHPELVAALIAGAQRWGVGSGSSHLLSGHFAVQEEAENACAQFVGLPAALLFGSGYAANLAVISSLLGRDDAVFADKLNHASLNDACLLSRATFKRFAHNDLAQLEYLLAHTPAKTRLIAVDTVYSMDGDEAPLVALLALAEKYQAWLYLDDAHGFGVLGAGRGALGEHALHSERVIYMATLGKAAGVSGAFVAASQNVITWLLNKARPYIYTTAQAPALSCAILASLDIIASASPQRAHLQQLIALTQQRLASSHYPCPPSRTPIQPIIVGSEAQTLALAAHLRTQGFWVPAIRPPTVAVGSARLRLSLSAQHQPQQLDALFDCLRQAGNTKS